MIATLNSFRDTLKDLGGELIAAHHRPGRFRRVRALERLRQGIDLVIMFTQRERKKFFFEVVEPWRLRGEMDCACFNRRGLSGHSHDLVTIGIDANGVDPLALQVLDQAQA